MIAIMLVTVSCKKNYTCSCDYTNSTAGIGTVQYTTERDLGKMTKKDARAKCETYNQYNAVSNYTSSATCQLK